MALVGLAVTLFLVGFNLDTRTSVPDHALIFVDSDAMTYLSPPCVQRLWSRRKLIRGRMGEIGNINRSGVLVRPDPDCVKINGFDDDRLSVSKELLERLGVISTRISRWNGDGTWNW
jgi:hypothetical protein